MFGGNKNVYDLAAELRAIGLDITVEELEETRSREPAMYENWFIDDFNYAWVFDEIYPQYG